MRSLITVLCWLSLLLASPALAGEQILFGAPADWVQKLPIPAAGPSPGGSVQVLLQDRQTRFENGAEEDYFETAFKVLSAQGLSEGGTLYAAWDPALSDLTIHAAQLIRGDQVIDILQGGAGFRTLRRETGLSANMLTGVLSAVKEIPDLRVGDIVVFATSVKVRWPVTGARAEGGMGLSRGGAINKVRYRALWPKTMDVRWKATAGVDGVKVADRGDSMELIYEANNIKAPKTPTGAPDRFAYVGTLELSAFDSWRDISQLFAPLYASATALRPDSPVKAEAAKIRAAYSSDEDRAMAALRLVEEEVRYLALTLGEGGLTPTAADTTWQQKFGDCKAKSALLIALLREFGIKADPVLIASRGGDGLPNRLPGVSAFDHVVVRALIGGKTYWLDGTRTGDRKFSSLQAPLFHYGLPVEAPGSDLQAIPFTPFALPIAERTLLIDSRGGVEKDGPVRAVHTLRGDAALVLSQSLGSAPRDEAKAFLIDDFEDQYSWFKVSSISFGYDESGDVFQITADGTGHLEWENSEGILQTNLGGDYEYEYGERPNSEDQTAPFDMGVPASFVTLYRIQLPDQGRGFVLSGADTDVTAGQVRVQRRSSIKDGVAELRLTVQELASEVTATEARAAKTRFEGAATSRYVFLSGSSRGRVQTPPRTAAGERPAITPETNRAMELLAVKVGRGDLAGAIRDSAKFIADSPRDSYRYAFRASLYLQNKDYDEALRDARRAIDLGDPPASLLAAEALLNLKRYRDALAIADDGIKATTGPRDAVVNALLQMDRGYALIGLQRASEAIDVFERAFFPPDGDGLDILDQLYWDVLAAAPAKARTEFETALSARPGSATARFLKALMLEQKDKRLAVTQYDEVVRLKPDWTPGREHRASVNGALKNHPATLVDLDWLVEKQPRGTFALQKRAAVYADMKDPKKMAESYAMAIQRSPNDANLRNSACWARATHGIELEDALIDCNEALRLQPGTAAYYDSRGLVYLRLDRAANAVADYDIAIARQPAAASFYGRALAKQKLGDEVGAKADYDAAARMSPTIAEAFAGFGLTR